MIAKLLPLLAASLLGACSTPGDAPSPAAAQTTSPAPQTAPAHATASDRTTEDLARNLLKMVDRGPTPDAFAQHLTDMSGELTDLARRPGREQNAKIDCTGTYESAGCWNATCKCDTLSSCGTLASWCSAVGGQETGLSCAKSVKGGCP